MIAPQSHLCSHLSLSFYMFRQVEPSNVQISSHACIFPLFLLQACSDIRPFDETFQKIYTPTINILHFLLISLSFLKKFSKVFFLIKNTLFWHLHIRFYHGNGI